LIGSTQLRLRIELEWLGGSEPSSNGFRIQ
jgi:hypothetical protein